MSVVVRRIISLYFAPEKNSSKAGYSIVGPSRSK